MKKNLALICALGISLLSGCGFHLPNQTRLSDTFESLNVQGDYHDAFYRKVVQELRISGIKVNAQYEPSLKADDKIPTLYIPSPQVSMPIASINANADTLEYQIIVSSTTTLRIPNHRPLLMRNSLTRNMLNKPGLSLSADTERAMVIEETYEELARQLVTRLGYLGRQSDPDALQSNPADLTVSVGEDTVLPSSKTMSDAYSGLTLIEALQLQDSEESAKAQSTNLNKLNNGNAVLNRTYELPKVAPKPKNALPDNLDPDNYNINE